MKLTLLAVPEPRRVMGGPRWRQNQDAAFTNETIPPPGRPRARPRRTASLPVRLARGETASPALAVSLTNEVGSAGGPSLRPPERARPPIEATASEGGGVSCRGARGVGEPPHRIQKGAPLTVGQPRATSTARPSNATCHQRRLTGACPAPPASRSVPAGPRGCRGGKVGTSVNYTEKRCRIPSKSRSVNDKLQQLSGRYRSIWYSYS